MSSSLRRTLVALLFCLFAGWSWSPLFEHGLRAEEQALVEGLAPLDSVGSFASFRPLGGHLVGVALTKATAAATQYSVERPAAAVWRAHHALVLLGAAWFLGRMMRRLARPWIGDELARACGWASAMLLALHPLAVGAVGAVRAGPMLWALLFALAALWCHLRGRQERSPRWIASALVLTALAGLTHGVGLAVPLWLAAAEFAAGARHRPSAAKWRSALSMFGAAAAVVALDSFVRSFALGELRIPIELARAASAWSDPLAALAVSIERIGVLLLAVNAHVLGAPGFVLAGAATLAMLHPMLGAARSAPRLWGWILLAFALGIASTEWLASGVRVHPQDLADADSVLATAAAVAAAGAVAITSRSGLRRILLPLGVALAYSILGHAHALAHRDAAREVDRLRAALESEDERPVLVEAPAAVRGVRAFAGGPWRCADLDAFGAWIADPASDTARANRERWLQRRGDVSAADENAWRAGELRPRAANPQPQLWLREGRSPPLDIDPLNYFALVVSFDAPLEAPRPLVLAWRTAAREGSPESEGRVEGSWSRLGDAPQACFDLARAPEWLASSDVRLIWSESGWSRIASAQLTARLPAPPCDPRPSVRGDDWDFAALETPLFERGLELEYVLVLTDLDELSSTSIPGRPSAEGGLRFERAQALVREMRANGAARVAWSLETRSAGRCVERLRGVVGP